MVLQLVFQLHFHSLFASCLMPWPRKNIRLILHSGAFLVVKVVYQTVKMQSALGRVNDPLNTITGIKVKEQKYYRGKNSVQFT